MARDKRLPVGLTACEQQGNRAFLGYFALLGLAAALVFGRGGIIESRLTIPLVQLSVDRDTSALLALVASVTALAWFYANIGLRNLIAAKLKSLLDERYPGMIPALWHLQQPSVLGVGTRLAATEARLDVGMGCLIGLLLPFSIALPIPIC